MGIQGVIPSHVGQPRPAFLWLFGLFLQLSCGVTLIYADLTTQSQTQEQAIITQLHPYSVPKEEHPFGRRVYILDQQTYAPFFILTYTQTGEFLRLLLVHAHPAYYPGNERVSLPVLSGASVINYARQRATLFSTDGTTSYNPPLSAQRFGLMEILRRGK